MKLTKSKQEKNLQDVIHELGLKLTFVAEKAKISRVELYYVLRGKRKTKAYDKKELEVRKFLRKLGARV
ncbi:MAG: hypothetical protein J0M18_20055 [Ignavibacteria bacterium]|nr:hypothetical protein [Ignavibacteria bacterium]